MLDRKTLQYLLLKTLQRVLTEEPRPQMVKVTLGKEQILDLVSRGAETTKVLHFKNGMTFIHIPNLCALAGYTEGMAPPVDYLIDHIGNRRLLPLLESKLPSVKALAWILANNHLFETVSRDPLKLPSWMDQCATPLKGVADYRYHKFTAYKGPPLERTAAPKKALREEFDKLLKNSGVPYILTLVLDRDLSDCMGQRLVIEATPEEVAELPEHLQTSNKYGRYTSRKLLQVNEVLGRKSPSKIGSLDSIEVLLWKQKVVMRALEESHTQTLAFKALALKHKRNFIPWLFTEYLRWLTPRVMEFVHDPKDAHYGMAMLICKHGYSEES